MREWVTPEPRTPAALFRRWWAPIAATMGAGILLAALYAAVVADVATPSHASAGVSPGAPFGQRAGVAARQAP
jgi:hypothetical protein